jgi:hypothetical protein
MNKSILAVAVGAIMLASAILSSPGIAYAHTFSGDESASFLALVEVIKVHLQLVRTDIATNATNAMEHAEHAGEHLSTDIVKEITEKNERLGRELPESLDKLSETLESGNYTASVIDEQVSNINGLLDETVSVRIQSIQLTNSTVQGTMLADLVDEILESYNGAYGIEEEEHDEDHDAADEDSMNMSNSTAPAMKDSEETSADSENTTIVNVAAYEGAQALTARAQELFDTKLRALADANATQAVTDLDVGLRHLKEAIDDKEPHDDVDLIVHSEVHPNIQEAFNLQVVPEFPMPILAALTGIAGIVAYSRFKRGRLT